MKSPKWLFEKILEKIKKEPEYESVRDLYEICADEEIGEVKGYLKYISEVIEERIKAGEDVMRFYELHYKVLFRLAPVDFESFLLFTEWEREAESKFYVPRRKQLKVVVEQLQRLADDELDILGISLPPGVGKSTLAMFFITWLEGRNPSKPVLTGSHNTEFVRGAYDECLRMMEPNGEYLFSKVFPESRIVSTNAKNCRIDMGTNKRFESLQFTTIGSGNAGLYRAVQLLYCDDLVSGIEVAMSKERLDTVWRDYTADLRQRKQGKSCKELHIATRWSVYDVLGRLSRAYEDNPRAYFLTVPALNEKDESNFDYPYDLGFTTQMYHEQRKLLDDATWRAVFMNQPIEREGQLYVADEMRRYSELPDVEPDAILAVCDTKDTGKDFCVLPVGYKFGDDVYIYDCVCDNGRPETVEAKLPTVLARNDTQMARFESNNVGGKIAEKVQSILTEMGARCRITTKFSKANKETRIIVNSGYVKEHFLFLMPSSPHWTAEYGRMFNMLVTWTMGGRNKHDDVPDAFASFADYLQSFEKKKVTVIERPF